MDIKKRLVIAFVLFPLLFASCMPGLRTARSFVEKQDSIAVMIVPSSFSYLYFYPFDATRPQEQFNEPASLEESYFLKDLNDSLADELFTESLFRQLKQYRIRVYRPEQFDQFLALDGDRYIFTMAQTEIQEYEQPFVERALIDTTLYRQAFLLNQVARNTWFEFVKVDNSATDIGIEVLYSSFLTSDVVEGRFRYRAFSGEVIYEYSAEVLNPDDIYQLQQYAGRMNAIYIFEHLLNRHVQQNARSLMGKPVRFRYNPATRQVQRIRSDEGFVVVE